MMMKFIVGVVCLLLFVGDVNAKTALDEVPDESLLPFRMGNNPGYYGGYWDDAKATNLSSMAGIDGQRKKMPDQHLVNWGYGIEIGDCKTANKVGVYDLIAYLATPHENHSAVPSNPENNIPLNLYEPIFNSSGEANPNNYWAYYVSQVAKRYKDYFRIYEVYNEPDYTDWRIPSSWETQPPNASDLYHWHGSIFEYNRIMRITYEVVKSIDPTAWVAPGGLGYTSFLDAMLRYTDNPTDGSVTSSYPNKGGAYFDCLSYHQYPMYGQTDEKTGVGYHKSGSDNLAMKFVTLKKNMEYRLEKYGFNGNTYPRKMFICTETGLSDIQYGDNVGGELVRRNYVLKQQLYAREYGIKQSHWFGVADFGGDNVYGHMGDFYTIGDKTLETAVMKDSSKGRLVWNSLQLGKMNFDSKKTQSLRKMLNDIQEPVNHSITATFFTKNSRTSWPYSPNEVLANQSDVVIAFWRLCMNDTEETELLELTLATDQPCNVIRYDGSTKTFSDGNCKVRVDGTPVFVIPLGEVKPTTIIVAPPEEVESASINAISLHLLLILLFVSVFLM